MATSTGEDDRWSFSTNWTIAAGSLSSSIFVDSSLEEEEEEEEDHTTPLILSPPSPDSQPCEIIISFAQKQEVRQVYVRSTARVYEIYSGRSLGSSNDYLCTVRCGIATRDEEVLHATDVEPVGAHSKKSNGEQGKENCSSSEDDWVEVKVLDMPLQDDRHNLACEMNTANPQSNLQDLYEATAEFTDSDACTSLTLRLLSLQTKDWINIDEIYVFSDPAESADSEAQVAPVGNSATTSLMSMLVPTLIQLSKSRDAQRQDLLAQSSSGKGEYLDVGSKVNHSANIKNWVEQGRNEAPTKRPEVHIPEQELDVGSKVNHSTNFKNWLEQGRNEALTKRPEVHIPEQELDVGSKVNYSTNFKNWLEQGRNEALTKPPEVHIPEQELDVGSKVNHSTNFEIKVEQERIDALTKLPDVHISEQELDKGKRYTKVAQTDVLTDRIECVLEQLVSRVSRIEDICLRFEENMLNPIKSMEQRLQLVEEQVQVLVKNSQHSEFPSYTRISAPEFSCGESNSSSFYTERNENPSCAEVELEKDGTISDKVPNSSNAKLNPGLVISAPEFSCNDDEENSVSDGEANNGSINPVNDFPQEKPRKALSIDDALAAALFGLMAKTSAQPAHYTRSLTVKAPEFTLMENDDDDMTTIQNENPMVPHIFCSESNGTECNDGVVSSAFEGDNGKDKIASETVICLRSEAELELPQTNDSQIADLTGVGEPSDEITDSVKNYILNAVSENTEVDGEKEISKNSINWAGKGESQNADSTSVGEPSDEATISASGNFETVEECSDNTEVKSEKSILGNTVDSFSWASCALDFELPILDVKFPSSEFQSASSSLDALFASMSIIEASSMAQKNEDEKSDSVANSSSYAHNELLLDWEVNNASYEPSSLEGEGLYEPFTHDKQDSFSSLL